MAETKTTLPRPHYDDEIDLQELLHVLLSGKWLIGGSTFAATVVAVIVAFVLPNIYRAEAVLAPNEDESTGGLSALAAQYGGLASLAGINLGGKTSDKTALGLEILKSRKFISDFIQRHDILVPLMAAKGVDLETGELKIDSNIYDESTKKWVRAAWPPRDTIPSLQEAYEQFSERNLSITQDTLTGFVTIAVEHYSPFIAKQWVDWLVEDINFVIMTQDVAKAEQAIDYLNKQIQATSLAELESIFFDLIEEQMKTVILAKVSPEYLFITIDPAIVPERKAKPSRILILVLGTLLGAISSTLFIIFRQLRQKSIMSRNT